MRLKEITFVFENCDSITIPEKYVGDFIVDRIKTSIKRVACNSITKIECCKDFAIEIHKEANKERYPFECSSIGGCKEKTFSRFMENDITSICFTLYDEHNKSKEENYEYYVEWSGDSEYVNEAQTNMISDLGHLYVVISKKPFEKFFDIKEINEEDYVNFRMDMYAIGDENWENYQSIMNGNKTE